jgi:hypothetical protein
MNIPEIKIFHAWLLDNAFKEYIKFVKEPEKFKVIDDDQVKDKIALLTTVWKEKEKTILEGMCRVIGLEFSNNSIDVNMVGTYWKAFSTPLVVSAKYAPEDFIDVLTHELIHVILTKNTTGKFVGDIWDKLYSEAISKSSRNHVLVHAIHKAIYLDVLNQPERLQLDINKCQKAPGYADAWNIVEKRGYKELIEEFKSAYLN